MKIKINFTVDIDVDAWCLAYGDEPSEVREAVKCYVEYGAKAQFDGLDLTTKPPQ
jgi:hypothetical protein